MKFQDYWDDDQGSRAKGLKRRDTRSWCKGVPGREHKYLYLYDRYEVTDCHGLWKSGYVSGFRYEVCEVCRKRKRLRGNLNLREDKSYILLTRTGFVESIIFPGYWLDRNGTKKMFLSDVAFRIARDRLK